ncbi:MULTISPECIES: AraC family transcriptional regulator [Kosakonia]|uniref:AraC family transcriptional regulator n=1 Tax=Kosakonia TaxID=1330547 RepID=UPI0005631952|nr:helix-turn-helix transcriptional regulator [Kosakonia radicincitans]NCF05522.1 AraC family transcriptional regulator [Kosakonia sp. MH5]APG18726.1 AraC family transcriptional regulator [Kosakonia radicincitans]MDD7993635.1 helix-turn-helix transcriptional regulator [Kosakonia radicincitans]SES79840.1 AraC-type DNA-binding protein [Kosakonia radicincitans]VVT52334.1 Transcriptional regulator, AraC family [Kosakonia radicincitans]
MRTLDHTPSEFINPLLPVFSMKSESISDDWELKPHKHPEAQLLFSVKGTMICEVKNCIRLIPPQCAIWIPTNVLHSTRGSGNTDCYCIFIDTSLIKGLPSECSTLSVSPLLRELIIYASGFNHELIKPSEQKIIDILVDQIKISSKMDVSLSMPSESRLYSLANMLIKNPGDNLKLKDWANKINMSERSFTRLVHQELGMSFGRWKQQLHIVIALQRISQGDSITTIALDLGYENTSGFVTMFKKVLGKPPLSYYKEFQDANIRNNNSFRI